LGWKLSSDANAFVSVGQIVKAIGLKGELKLYPFMDYFDELLDSPFVVWQDGSEVGIRHYRQAGACVAVSVHGVTGRTAAEAMIGRELGFLRSSYEHGDFPVPSGGLVFRFLGRKVCTTDGQSVGTVSEVRLAGGVNLLVIPQGDKEILIPAVSPILEQNDSLEGDLIIDPPEGLLDVHTG
jgi:16S rRNA processing protein RimM